MEKKQHIEDVKKDGKSCCRVNKKLLPYKSHYFLFNGAHVGVLPYLPVFAKANLGFSATTIGMLSTCMMFSQTLSKPLFGLLADCFNQLKMFIVALLTLEVVVNLSMLALPRIETPVPNELPIPSAVSSWPSSWDGVTDSKTALVYNATVTLYQKTGYDWDPNSTTAYYPLQLINLTDSYIMSEVPVYDNLHEYQTYKCDLTCNGRIDTAICHQSVRQCINPSSTSFLSCRFRRKHHKICDGGQKKHLVFNIAYDVTNIASEDSQKSSQIFHSNEAVVSETKTPHRRGVNTPFCNVTTADCYLKCSKELVFCGEEQTKPYEPETEYYYHTYQFWVFCILALVGSMCHGALFTLSDTACYETIRGTDSDYGRQRFWGSIGWSIASPIGGYLNHLSSSDREDYSAGWYLMAILSLLCLGNLLFMKVPNFSKSPSIGSDVRKILLSRNFMLMEVNVLLMGMLNAYAVNYVIWYMQSLDATHLQMGMALTMSCLFGEGPFLFISGWIISKLGHWHCVTLIFGGFALRFLSYYFIFNPWIILPVEILHGITFGLCYVTMTSYGEHVSLLGTEATVQGVLGGTYQGIGNGLGCLVAGISFDLYGGRKSFLLVAILSGSLAFCHYILCLICKPEKAESEKPNQACEV